MSIPSVVKPGRWCWRYVAAVGACALVVAGCAAHRQTTVADRFIKHGKPSINYGGKLGSTPTADYVSQLRKLSLEARPRAKTVSPEVAEVKDERLRNALAQLAAGPSADGHRQVAIEYRRLGIADAAFTHLSAAIKLDPKDAASYDLRARIWRGWGTPELGLPDARKAVALAPQSATAWNTLGLLLDAGGQTDEGVRAYLHAVVLEDAAPYAWSNLCRVWTVKGDGSSAVQACKRALALAPGSPTLEMNLVKAERLLAPARPIDAEQTTASGDRTREDSGEQRPSTHR